MNNFEKAITNERKRYQRRYISPNLTPMMNGLIKKLGKNEMHKVISADKNCGFAIIETEHLTERGVSEHLGNPTVYKRLTQGEAIGQLQGVERLIESFISSNARRYRWLNIPFSKEV